MLGRFFSSDKESGAASSSGYTSTLASNERLSFEWFRCVQDNQIDVVENFIASGIDVEMIEEWSGKTALHYALDKQNLQMIQVLLKAGIDLNRAFILSPKPEQLFYSGANDEPDPIYEQEQAVDNTQDETAVGASAIPASMIQSLDDEEPLPAESPEPLEASADNKPPKSTDSHSPKLGYLEYVLIPLGQLVINKSLKRPAKIDMPVFERIIDMLLCYGMKADIPWTLLFQKAMAELIEAATYSDMTANRRLALADTVVQARNALPENTFSEKVNKAVRRPLVGLLHIALKHKAKKEHVKDLADYVNAIYSLRPNLHSTIDSMAQQKAEILQNYKAKTSINAFFKENGVSDLILEYSGNISDELVKQRIADKQTIKLVP